MTREDKDEIICSDIRQAARNTKEDFGGKDVQEAGGTWQLCDFEFGPAISKGCNAIVYAAKCVAAGFENLGKEDVQEVKATSDKEDYPLAVKMMFNFNAESNAPALFKAMKK